MSNSSILNNSSSNSYARMDQLIGNTPLVQLRHLLPAESSNTILVKLEGTNPGGSVKDRAALNMIDQAEKRGNIKPGDTLVEATSGNTGIALAMVAAMRGYHMTLIMPDNMSMERRASMAAYGASLKLVSQDEGGMEAARDMAIHMQEEGEAYLLNQFDNPDNAMAHYHSTGPEIWNDTNGQITHFVSAMGTTGTITGTAKYLKEKRADIKIAGVQPLTNNEDIPGIRRWSQEYLPKIYNDDYVDIKLDMTQALAEETMRRLAREEGIFCGVSSGGAVAAALELEKQVENATIVSIICDRGDRYISTGVFPAE